MASRFEVPAALTKAKKHLDSAVTEGQTIQAALDKARRELVSAQDALTLSGATLSSVEADAALTGDDREARGARKAFLASRDQIAILEARVTGLQGRLKLAEDKSELARNALRIAFGEFVREVGQQADEQYSHALDAFIAASDRRAAVAVGCGDGRTILNLRNIAVYDPEKRLTARFARDGWKNQETEAIADRLREIREQLAVDGVAPSDSEPMASAVVQ